MTKTVGTTIASSVGHILAVVMFTIFNAVFFLVLGLVWVVLLFPIWFGFLSAWALRQVGADIPVFWHVLFWTLLVNGLGIWKFTWGASKKNPTPQMRLVEQSDIDRYTNLN